MPVTIRAASSDELHLARAIAHITWPVAYSHILAPGQLEYMLDRFYSDEALNHQSLQLQHRFYWASDEDENCVGFASYSFIGIEETLAVYKLHKLYVLPDCQKSGIGRQLLLEVMTAVKQQGGNLLILNVNRHNSALQFYLKWGFEIIRQEDIDIGNGYFMNDFVLGKQLT